MGALPRPCARSHAAYMYGGKGNEKGGSFVPCKEEQDWSAQITGLLGFLICLRGTNIYSKGTNLDIKCGVIISR